MAQESEEEISLLHFPMFCECVQSGIIVRIIYFQRTRQYRGVDGYRRPKSKR
jgi:hypothetical protein